MLRIALLLVALAAGGAAAWVALSLRGESTVATIVEPATPVPVQDVLVAAADLKPGQALTKESMRWQSWPESALNPLYITRSARPDALEIQPKGLVGSIVHSRMTSGEPIRDENLAAHNASSLSEKLEKGKRAVAVVVEAKSFAGGLIQQGDQVDVISTVTPTAITTKTQTATETTSRTSQEGQTVSTIILRKVLVLAIDLATEQTVDERSKDEKGKTKEVFVGKTATLELDPSQVKILATNDAVGKLSLALRSAKDNHEELPLPPLPPSTRLQRSQSWAHATFGRIEIIELVKSEKLVEVNEPEKPSVPPRAPKQRVASEPQ